MKKVLIITYYWPPAGGGGVQRWVKFVKYLPQLGWYPIVFIPENPDYPNLDHEMVKEVSENILIIKGKIIEPNQILHRLKKKEQIHNNYLSKGRKNSLLSKFMIFIRANFFIPDARMLWIKPSIKKLSAYLDQNKVDVIVSTGPPQSSHLIAKPLKIKYNIPWIADFRDAWSQIEFFDEIMLTKRSRAKHLRLEKEVLDSANVVTTVGDLLAEDLRKLTTSDIRVIRNGFDEADYKDVEPVKFEGKFVISYIGSMLASQNPEIFWQALEELYTENPSFAQKLHINMVGTLDNAVIDSISKCSYAAAVHYERYVPHSKAIGYQLGSDVLLLCINKSVNNKHIITGKVFEYLYTNKPIVCTGPLDGEVAYMFKDLQNALIFDYNDKDGIKKYIFDIYNQNVSVAKRNIEDFSRLSLTQKLVNILNEVSSC